MPSPISPEAPKDPSEDIPGIQPTAPHEAKGSSNSAFSQMLNAPKSVDAGSGEKTAATSETSPMQLPGMGRRAVPTKANESTVLGAMDGTSTLNTEVQERLQNTKASDLDRSKQFLLNEKLNQANQHIEATAKQAGVDPSKFPLPSTEGKGPIAKFLALLQHGQNLLHSASTTLPKLAKEGNLKPGDFLAMQMKLSVAMVELDFSSQLLGKSGDAISKLMNVNI